MMGYVGSRVYVQSSLYLYEKEYPWKIESEEYLYMTSTTCDLIFVNKIMIKKNNNILIFRVM